MKYLIVILLALTAVACDKTSDDGTLDRARKESEAGKDIDNENLAQKARRMEADLRRRYRFYQAVSHTYEGRFQGSNGVTYAGRVSMTPTLHVEETDRVRELEEIQYDLNNLFLNVQVYLWRPSNGLGLMNCSFADIRPDTENGIIYLVSDNCKNTFTVHLTVRNTSERELDDVSRRLAQAIKEGTQSDIDRLSIKATSTVNPANYRFEVRRK